MRKCKVACFLVALLFSFPVNAQDFQNGVQAYVQGKYSLALREWLPLAGKGHASAQFSVGALYAEGRGTKQDFGWALHWFRSAAEQGHQRAQHNLAVMYERGRGVAKDQKVAVCWYHKAASQGDFRSRYNLAVMYTLGYGIEKNLILARNILAGKAVAYEHQNCAPLRLF